MKAFYGFYPLKNSVKLALVNDSKSSQLTVSKDSGYFQFKFSIRSYTESHYCIKSIESTVILELREK